LALEHIAAEKNDELYALTKFLSVFLKRCLLPAAAYWLLQLYAMNIEIINDTEFGVIIPVILL
jgi:hypothetical protein